MFLFCRPNVPTVTNKPPDLTFRRMASSPESKVGVMPVPDILAAKYTPQKPKVDEKTAKLEVTVIILINTFCP